MNRRRRSMYECVSGDMMRMLMRTSVICWSALSSKAVFVWFLRINCETYINKHLAAVVLNVMYESTFYFTCSL